MWLLETGSSTHNEFRLAARPLSGDLGVSTPLLINTRGGSKIASGGLPRRARLSLARVGGCIHSYGCIMST